MFLFNFFVRVLIVGERGLNGVILSFCIFSLLLSGICDLKGWVFKVSVVFLIFWFEIIDVDVNCFCFIFFLVFMELIVSVSGCVLLSCYGVEFIDVVNVVLMGLLVE